MRLIPLTKGKFAKIDDEVFDVVSKIRWQCGSHGYAKARLGNKTLYMHRLVMNALPGKEVDHINQDSLDNRKFNLRLCNHQQNLRNSRLSKRNKSGYVGAYQVKESGHWVATARVQGHSVSLGTYETPEEAAYIHDQVSYQLFGPFARLNDLRG